MSTKLIDQFQRADFRTTTLSFLTIAGNAWINVLNSKKREASPKTQAEGSIPVLMYALDHINDMEFIRYQVGADGLSEAVTTLMNISIAHGKGDDKDKAKDDLDEMLAIAKDFAVQSE